MRPACLRHIGLISVLTGAAFAISACTETPQSQYSAPENFVAAHSSTAAEINPTAPGFSAVMLGKNAVSTNEMGPMARWNNVIVRFAQERRHPGQFCTQDQTRKCARAIWKKLVASLRALPLSQRVIRVNRFFNKVPYVPAELNWHNPAYWETPFQFLERGGQCQDYAISKYLALLDSGVPEQDLRFVVLYDSVSAQNHAITVVDVHGKVLALDNQMSNVTPVRKLRWRYSPYYALNDRGWWSYVSPEAPMVAWQLPKQTGLFTSSFQVARD